MASITDLFSAMQNGVKAVNTLVTQASSNTASITSNLSALSSISAQVTTANTQLSAVATSVSSISAQVTTINSNLSTMNTNLAKIFPQQTAISSINPSSVGALSFTSSQPVSYMVVQSSSGGSYKIPLYNT